MPRLSNLQRLDDFSAFLSLIGLILSIQSSQVARRDTSRETTSLSDKIITVAVFIAACSNFIDLGTAKTAYERLKSNPNTSELKLQASYDLLMSRYFSTLAVIFLIRSTLETNSEHILGLASPSGIGGIT